MTTNPVRTITLVLAFLSFTAPVLAEAPPHASISIIPLPSAYIPSTQQPRISADGAVVAFLAAPFDGSPILTRWTAAGGREFLGAPSGGLGGSSEVTGLSADGSVIIFNDGQGRAYRWTRSTGIVALLPPSLGDAQAYANDITSDGGTIVGSARRPGESDYSAVIWPNGSTIAQYLEATGLPAGAALATASAVSGDAGTIAGRLRWSSSLAAEYRNTYTLRNGIASINIFANASQSRVDLSADGQVLLIPNARDESGTQRGAMRFTPNSYQVIALGPSRARINVFHTDADGSTVVGGLSSTPAVWTLGRPYATSLLEELTIAGVTIPAGQFGSASDLSADGQTIVGRASATGQRDTFFIAVLPQTCPADFTRDGMIDDDDFVIFSQAYSAFYDERGDFTGDHFTDDRDFVIFAAAYERMTCN